MIDLRSDTITTPTEGMRQAIARAEVGDDVFGDDPTVIRLEREVAERLGTEAALYVPSGTMANQLAVRSHTEPGDEILVDANAHIYFYEAGASAALSGVICRCLDGRRGIFDVDQVQAALRPVDVHFAPTRLLCLENTHNRGGGAVWPLAQFEAVCGFARDRGLRVHLDGARLWNAAQASGVAEARWVAQVDSVSVCFSKGLGAPVGSVLAGRADFIVRARRFRKQFGGGMRQVGLLAAAALYALEHHRSRLGDDHANARTLAEGLAALPGLEVRLAEVETNIVQVHVHDLPAAELATRLAQAGVRVLATGPALIRAVTNLTVDAAAIDRAIEAFRRALRTA